MSKKRTATSDLNHDNWDREEEPEEQGTFRKASEDILKNRPIRTARRRNPIRSETGDKPGVFTSFTGFGNKPAGADFSFLKDLSKSEATTKTNGIDASPKLTMPDFNKTDTSKTTGSIFGGGTGAPPVPNIFGAGNLTSSASTTSNCLVPSLATGDKKSENYCARLKGLNESVSKWIVKKVEENPLISLQPIFKDYEKYLNDIEKEESSSASGEKFASKGENVSSSDSFNFNLLPENTQAAPSIATAPEKTTQNQPTFKFGTSSSATGINSNIPTFSFGSKANNSGPTKSFSDLTSASGATTTPSFSFGSSVSNSSTSLAATTTFSLTSAIEKPTENQQENNDDDEEPPKPDFTPVVEKDHIYTVKCKVFVKKEDNFGDRGVGNLYLKPVENSEKVQLIVRADTNLGNLLLNFILSKSVPTKRMGKRDVMLVALPMPDAKPPPTPILVRVKSSEEADKLLEVLEKHKK